MFVTSYASSGSSPLLPNCGSNFVLRDYHPYADGESPESARGVFDTRTGLVRLISKHCVCPAGFYISGSSCNKCPDGQTTYADDTYDACEQVCSGVMGSDGQCAQECKPGQYLLHGRCADCPAGHQGYDGGCLVCPASYYSDAAGSVCTRCTGGMTTAEEGAWSAAACSERCATPNSLVDADGSCVAACSEGAYLQGSYCSACPPGQQVPRGVDGMADSDCQPCTRGTYKGLFEAACSPCPGRTTTADAGSTTAAQCTEDCGDDYVGTDGACTKDCNGGEIVVDGRCHACAADQFSSVDQTTCLDNCPGGQEGVDGACRRCQSGTMRPSDADPA